MALILTDEQSYEKIANSIRAKNGSTETYTPEQMSEAIDAMSIGSGGGDMFKEHYATQSDTKVDTALNAEALGGTPASGFVLSADFNAHNEDASAHQDIRDAIPNVPAWAKAENKPTYTASEVGAAPAYTYGTSDLTAGSSTLATGTLYFVYEE